MPTLQENTRQAVYRDVCVCTCATWGSLSLHSCLWSGGMADWAGGQCSPSVLPFTEYSGVLPSVMSKVRNTRNSSASYSKNSSVASRQGRGTGGQHLFWSRLTAEQKKKEQTGGKQPANHQFAYPVTNAGGNENNQKATCIDVISIQSLFRFLLKW